MTPGRIFPGVVACGGDVPIAGDVRIVAATNKYLQRRVGDVSPSLELEKNVIGNAARIKNGNLTQPAPFLRIPRNIRIYPARKVRDRRGGSLLLESTHSEPEAAPSQAEEEERPGPTRREEYSSVD